MSSYLIQSKNDATCPSHGGIIASIGANGEVHVVTAPGCRARQPVSHHESYFEVAMRVIPRRHALRSLVA